MSQNLSCQPGGGGGGVRNNLKSLSVFEQTITFATNSTQLPKMNNLQLKIPIVTTLSSLAAKQRFFLKKDHLKTVKMTF